MPPERFPSLVPAPGSGGVDIAALDALAHGSPATRRDILWPKAYECPWSKALPVFEAGKALTMLNDALTPLNLEAQAVLIRSVQFRPEYEQQLQQIQLNEQNKLLDRAREA